VLLEREFSNDSNFTPVPFGVSHILPQLCCHVHLLQKETAAEEKEGESSDAKW
jgi:hypothetical protein